VSERSPLTDLVRRGRRRQLWHLLVHQSSFASLLALCGAVLLLILGTQILNWYWLVILFGGSLAVGVYRTRSRILSAYQVAQSIDRRLELHDALSTAYFFGEHPGRTDSPRELIQRQLASAEDLARSADLERGIPFCAPRSFYFNAGLALAVVAMFGLRYGINRSLDLRPSLVHIGFDGFLGSAREIADAKKTQHQRPFDQDGHRDQGQAVDPWESKSGDLDPAPSAALQTIDTPDVNNPDGGADPKAKATGEQQQQGDDALDRGEKGEPSQAGNDAANESNSSPDGSKTGQQASQKDVNQSPNSGENSSLADKMRDALANLLAKMKMQPKSGSGKQGTSKQNGNQSAQKQSQSQDANSSSTSQQQSDASAMAQSQGQQQSSNASQQSAQGKSDSHSADKPNSPDGKSGIGRQDGDKSAREAEQLAAMGKLSEIIGKRAANVTGEVMVEVASGKQQLRTQYTDRKATHVEAGGEINRDEVPLSYQQYVQQYFEEVRKLPAKGKSDAKSKDSGN